VQRTVVRATIKAGAGEGNENCQAMRPEDAAKGRDEEKGGRRIKKVFCAKDRRSSKLRRNGANASLAQSEAGGRCETHKILIIIEFIVVVHRGAGAGLTLRETLPRQ
jgi:hypothetical protein